MTRASVTDRKPPGLGERPLDRDAGGRPRLRWIARIRSTPPARRRVRIPFPAARPTGLEAKAIDVEIDTIVNSICKASTGSGEACPDGPRIKKNGRKINEQIGPTRSTEPLPGMAAMSAAALFFTPAAAETKLDVVWMGRFEESVKPLMDWFRTENPDITQNYQRIPYNELLSSLVVRRCARTPEPEIDSADASLTAPMPRAVT